MTTVELHAFSRKIAAQPERTGFIEYESPDNTLMLVPV